MYIPIHSTLYSLYRFPSDEMTSKIATSLAPSKPFYLDRENVGQTKCAAFICYLFMFEVYYSDRKKTCLFCLITVLHLQLYSLFEKKNPNVITVLNQQMAPQDLQQTSTSLQTKKNNNKKHSCRCTQTCHVLRRADRGRWSGGEVAPVVVWRVNLSNAKESGTFKAHTGVHDVMYVIPA